MLTIAKLGTGRASYYLNTVAKGIEDYYAGHGEAPGVWRGAAAGYLGLEGDVDGELLQGLLEGRLPGEPPRVGKAAARRTPGWDLTFSAPKSVSVMFGLSERDVTQQVVAAHDVAVGEGLAYLEQWALSTRRRHDGQIIHEPAEGMIVAGFRHRTSREVDPQIHTHALLVNLTLRAGGGWGAIDSRVIYRQAKAAGHVYQAVLRSQLTERLGVAWDPVDRRGIAELTAVPRSACELFSKRRRQIEQALDEHGASSARAADIAARRSRLAKGHVAGTDALRATWRAEAAEHAIDTTTIQQAPRALTGRDQLDAVSARQRRHINDRLLGSDGLTEQRTSFQRSDLIQGWSRAIDPRTIGVTATAICELVDTTVIDPRAVLLGHGRAINGVDTRRWSTTELLQIEQRILDTVASGRHADIGVADRRVVDDFIDAHPTLSDEQSTMIRTLTTGGHRIDAVIGVAGSGKTYALSIANEIWQQAGHHVIGAALAKRAAHQLQTDSAIASTTLDSLLLQLDRPDTDGIQPGTIVVIDEAGMVPTRHLDRLLNHCGPDVKVVLDGDHKQLPEIGAGGLLRGLHDRYGDELSLLTDNRRQHDPDERHALAELRDGDIHAGIDWYITEGRVHTLDDSNGARAAMIDAWWHDRQICVGDQLDDGRTSDRRRTAQRACATSPGRRWRSQPARRHRHRASRLRRRRRRHLPPQRPTTRRRQW